MDTGEKIYQHIINNEKIYKDYFDSYEKKEYTIEDLFSTFISESELSDSAKLKILKKINKEDKKKKTIFEYFDAVQSNFNVLFYGMKI